MAKTRCTFCKYLPTPNSLSVHFQSILVRNNVNLDNFVLFSEKNEAFLAFSLYRVLGYSVLGSFAFEESVTVTVRNFQLLCYGFSVAIRITVSLLDIFLVTVTDADFSIIIQFQLHLLFINRNHIGDIQVCGNDFTH